MKRVYLLSVFIVIVVVSAFTQSNKYITKTNLKYYNDSICMSDDYINERCVLDVYYPTDSVDYATIIWFHGGGLKVGNKSIPKEFKELGIGVVAVNYRLNPKVLAPKYIEDAAAAVAWVFNHIEDYGGDLSKIFLCGHSAGAYLVSMVGLDKKWLEFYNIDANSIAGLFPLSSQAITHLTIREERGIDEKQPIVDEFAPLFHVRSDAPPMLLITGDRELEILGRYEENAYMARMMKLVGHKKTTLLEMKGYGHNMLLPAFPLVIREIQRICCSKKGD